MEVKFGWISLRIVGFGSSSMGKAPIRGSGKRGAGSIGEFRIACWRLTGPRVSEPSVRCSIFWRPSRATEGIPRTRWYSDRIPPRCRVGRMGMAICCPPRARRSRANLPNKRNRARRSRERPRRRLRAANFGASWRTASSSVAPMSRCVIRRFFTKLLAGRVRPDGGARRRSWVPAILGYGRVSR